MYDIHCKEISKLCRTSDTYYQRMLQFVIFSIRSKFYLVKGQMAAYSLYGINCPAVWGFKYQALKEIDELNLETDFCDEVEAVEYFKSVTGFGNAKAGFAAQMLGYDVSCLDTHNLKRLGIKDVRTMSTHTYVELTQQTGGTEYWWNSWCDFIAKKYPKHFRDGYEVSEYHLNCITGD